MSVVPRHDEQGLVLAGARVSISSPALTGGPATQMTNEIGRLRFPVLPPGLYALEIEMPGFATLHDRDILIAAGSTMERTATLKPSVRIYPLSIRKGARPTRSSMASERCTHGASDGVDVLTETVFSPTFGQPVSFVDPRRAMIGIRLHLGR